ncbi:hypothetical protein GUITHDRAFT_99525 [Guillardia theta CCMP2712]|uniref:Uncharacterized protein n=1 Tax=Guillardia theta (strain CCMP2712) TaxID=905079 RepID=L1K3D8_GUITC|nr:hypothetical protein GUITHDRAFT_99525 [Guillardia theta CCMP2712]EKX54873.1 hypothetical protein GUITHDRAFT_99525 [Guillardia theta CCMP2712]|eukprot:XP_005841853.1 hypothetical protein GUITHDRAFT_99525 [Guillardia theta CCMP2712]
MAASSKEESAKAPLKDDKDLQENDIESNVVCCWGYSAAWRGLPACSAPSWTVRPYIHWGYRDHLTFKECLESLAYCHNEVGNIYTHLTASILFLVLLANDSMRNDLNSHHRAVAVLYDLASIVCLVSSGIFHLLGPVSKSVYENTLKLDMTGIACVIVASFLVGIHYGYWCHPALGQAYFWIIACLSLVAMSWPHVPWLFHNFNASVVFFACFVAFALVPLLHWVHLVGGPSSEQALLFFYKLLLTMFAYFLGFLFYITRFPEKKFIGRFDFVLHSHQKAVHALALKV